MKNTFTFSLMTLLVVLVVGCSGLESLPSVEHYRQTPTSLPDPRVIPPAILANADSATVEIEWDAYPSQLSPLVPAGLRVRVFQIVNNDHQYERRAYVFYGNGQTLYLGTLTPLLAAPVEKTFFNYGDDLKDDSFMLGRVDDKIAAPDKVTVEASRSRESERITKSAPVTFHYFLLPLFLKSGQGDSLNWIHQITIESADGTSVTRFSPPIQIVPQFKRS